MPRTSATNSNATSATPADDVVALASFLRRLAEQSERDPAFGAQLTQLARESGLTLAGARTAKRATSKSRGTRASATPSEPGLTVPPDPYAVLRAQGEDALRAALAGLDLAALRAIIRMHRLDPARTSARWTTRDRLATFIAERVCARANHGRAFEHV